jgi:hypothetical protein
MALDIESGIPIPSKGGPKPWEGSLTQELMMLQPGKSVLIPGYELSTLSGRISKLKRATGFHYTARTVDTGVRIWRVS